MLFDDNNESHWGDDCCFSMIAWRNLGTFPSCNTISDVLYSPSYVLYYFSDSGANFIF